MNRDRHTNSLYSHSLSNTGVYVDDTNQLVLFDTKELPLLVNPNKSYNSYARKIKREIVRKLINDRYMR